MDGGIDDLRAHLAALLACYLETDDIVYDDDGLVPIRSGSAVVFVGLVAEANPPLVHLRSPVLRGVSCSHELLSALNEINSRIGFGRLFWSDDAVMATENLVAETLDLAELRASCDTLIAFADQHDDELATRFGGHRAFEN